MKRFVAMLALAACGGGPNCEDAFHQANAKLKWSDKELAFAVSTCNKLGLSADTRTCVSTSSNEHDLSRCLEKDPDMHLALSRQRASEVELARSVAEQQAKDAIDAANKALADAEKLSRDLQELGTKVDASADALASAQNDADRQAARAKLDQLRKDKAALEARVQALKDAAAKAERAKGIHHNPQCLDNPLAPGCM